MNLSNEPTVCAVMLTADRPEMAKRAVDCFRSQTYTAKQLLVLDTGKSNHVDVGIGGSRDNERLLWKPFAHETIGALRNIGGTQSGADILIHWDDDDYSHPNRIAEQVALLQSSGADCVGYREMLFWREGEPPRYGAISDLEPARLGEAWLYSNPNPAYALGTSLCYWRKTWEAKPFEATSQGEDSRFITGLKCVGIESFDPYSGYWGRNAVPVTPQTMGIEPRMIARIHSGNTSNAYRPETMAKASEWKRVPAWDDYCRSVME